MSILQPNEIPGEATLRAMSADVLQHTANMYLDCYRIRRSAYNALASGVWVLRKGVLPEAIDPEKYRVMALAEQEDEWHLSMRGPLDQLIHMDKTSKFWFGQWAGLEEIAKQLRWRLRMLENENGRKKDEEEEQFLGEVAWGPGWKDGVRMGEEDEKELNEEEFLNDVQWLNDWKEGKEGVRMPKEMEERKKEKGPPASGYIKAWLGPSARDQTLL